MSKQTKELIERWSVHPFSEIAIAEACIGYYEEMIEGWKETLRQEVDFHDEEDKDPFEKPKDARKVGKYTPLHWASYKGFHKVVWILLKEGMTPLDIDMYGNTCVHQAAAAG